MFEPETAHAEPNSRTELTLNDTQVTKQVTKKRSCKNDNRAIGSREPSFGAPKNTLLEAWRPFQKTKL